MVRGNHNKKTQCVSTTQQKRQAFYVYYTKCMVSIDTDYNDKLWNNTSRAWITYKRISRCETNRYTFVCGRIIQM